MRNAEMERLDVLVGSWTTSLQDAWFIPEDQQPVPGTASVEWLGDAFVVMRWATSGEVGSAADEMVLVLGRSDARDEWTALYHDERGVCRVFAMTFDGARWVLSREDDDMFQRFVVDVSRDRLEGRTEASDDRGETWRKDFDLIFDRVR